MTIGRRVDIPYGHQSLDDADIAAVVAVLRSDWLTQGPEGEAFESALTEITGAVHAVTFASGTAALHAACAVAGLGPGDTLATSTLSFVASANCARYVGAEPVLLDIDPETLNIVPDEVPGTIDALVAVHFAGLPVDLSKLGARPRVVIEDGAHALGARTPDGPVGNCVRSDMCCFSFHPVKAVTCGEGGAVTTNDPATAEGLRRFRNHGIIRPSSGPAWRYDVATLGFNYRLTDIQAALGRSQLQKLDRFVGRRAELAERYRRLLADLPVVLPPRAPEGYGHAYHLFAVQIADRDRVYETLRAAGIGVQVHYPLTHRLGAFRGRASGRLPQAESVGDRILTLPLYPALAEDDQDRVVHELERAL